MKAVEAIASTYIDQLKNELTGEKFGDATAWVSIHEHNLHDTFAMT